VLAPLHQWSYSLPKQTSFNQDWTQLSTSLSTIKMRTTAGSLPPKPSFLLPLPRTYLLLITSFHIEGLLLRSSTATLLAS
jgi:hypothetical protein